MKSLITITKCLKEVFTSAQQNPMGAATTIIVVVCATLAYLK